MKDYSLLKMGMKAKDAELERLRKLLDNADPHMSMRREISNLIAEVERLQIKGTQEVSSLTKERDELKAQREIDLKEINRTWTKIDALETQLRQMREACEAITKHYEHPLHDHNWAHYANVLAKKALGQGGTT